MVKLQDDVVAKEEIKAAGMRQRFNERTKRFLDAKQRTIGVDKDYLHQQVHEKNLERIKQEEEGNFDAIRLEQLCNYLEERELAKQEVKLKELEDVQATLQEQVKQPKNNAIFMADPLDLENCGPSSIQRFQGEDNDYDSRKRQQQQQLQVWCVRQGKDMQDRLREQEKTEKDYSQYVIAEDKIRCEMHEQEKLNRAKKEEEIMMENLKLAEQRRIRKQEEKQRDKELEAAETRFVNTSPLFSEETDYSKSALSDLRVRPDHFKGFSLLKSKAIIEANASVAAEKEYFIGLEQQREQEWAEREADMIQNMEEMEMARKTLVEEDNKIQADTLRAQRAELKEKQRKMEKEKFGDISIGFFQKFGTSCR